MPTHYPRDRIEAVLVNAELPPSYRIIPRQYCDTPLGTAPSDSRFCARVDGFTVLYASPDFATAFIETVVRDRFSRKRKSEIAAKEITERAWTLITMKPRTELSLLDLRREGCLRLGAPTDTVNARNHAAGRAFGRAVYAGHQDIDGLIFSSRLTGVDAYAVFDRALEKLDTTDQGKLQHHPELPAVLARHKIRLVVGE